MSGVVGVTFGLTFAWRASVSQLDPIANERMAR